MVGNVTKYGEYPLEITAEIPRDIAFQTFMEGINGFTDDCFADGRELNILPAEREERRY